jgi:hypothetical protein
VGGKKIKIKQENAKMKKCKCAKCGDTKNLTKFMECGTWGRVYYLCNECSL